MDNTPYNDEQTEEREPRSTASRGNGNAMRTILIVLVILLAAFAAWRFFGNANQAVAEVNGEVITRGQYEQAIQNISQSSQQSGVAVDSPEAQAQIRSQALQTLIDRALVLDAADSEGITISEEEVDTRLEQAKEGLPSEEAYQEQLRNAGLTEAELREELRTELKIQKFIEARLPADQTTVTDQEVQDAYDSITAGNTEGDVPALEEIEEMLRTQLQNQKTNQGLQELLVEMRNEADIVVHIDQPAAPATNNTPSTTPSPETAPETETTPETEEETAPEEGSDQEEAPTPEEEQVQETPEQTPTE